MLLPRLRLTTILIWVAFIGLILALVAQNRLAERRERALKMQLAASLSNQFAQAEMSRILSDLGIDILKQTSGVELLRVFKRTGSHPNGNFLETVVTPTSVCLDDGIALRAACVLLDHRNYGYINADDDSDPQVGLRFSRGSSSLDILISLEGSHPGSPHQDLWIKIHNHSGELVHASGPTCMSDPDLQKLAEVLLSR
jgi:hypothetical protein